MRFQLSSFSYDIPEEWCDITPEDDPTYPFTMALEGGVGVIQVSLAEWTGGQRPDIDEDRLGAMFSNYCKAQNLDIEASTFSNGDVIGIGGECVTKAEFTGAWYVTNGVNVALVTYFSSYPDDPAMKAEFEVAEHVVESASFRDMANALSE